MARTLANRAPSGTVHAGETVVQHRLRRFAAVDVVVVRWPAERERREHLRQLGRPRLLLLEDGEPPPEPVDCLEDWARAPLDEADMHARLLWLEHRAHVHDLSAPVLDGDGVLRHDRSW